MLLSTHHSLQKQISNSLVPNPRVREKGWRKLFLKGKGKKTLTEFKNLARRKGERNQKRCLNSGKEDNEKKR